MSPQDRNTLKGEIRGITLPALFTFIAGIATVCGVVINGVTRIEKTFVNHEVRITELEKKADKAEALLLSVKAIQK